MNIRNLIKYRNLEHLLLLPLLTLAFYMAYIPHLNYPIHIDEWVHLAFAKAMLQEGSTTFVDPFLGQSMVGLISPNLEAGFHIFWGVFQSISGLSWLTIFRYFPGIVFALAILSVYVLAYRKGFGWEAAFFACLIPTTVGILGPGFLVPVALGLFFMPLSMFIAFNFKNAFSYLTLFLFICFLLVIHAPSAIFVVIVLIPYLILNLKSDYKHSLFLALALIIPFLAPFPWIFDMLLPTAKSLLIPQPLSEYVDFPRVIHDYGYIPVAFCLLGTFILIFRGGKENLGLILGLLAILLILVMRYTFHYGIHIIYARGLMFMMLVAAIVAGAGLRWLTKSATLAASMFKRDKPYLSQTVIVTLSVIIVGLTLSITIPDLHDIPYYHMINDDDYEAFIWIKNNVDDSYQKAILDPWKATAFTAITGRASYSRIHMAPTSKDEKAYEFLENGCRDTDFLRENGISIVYNRASCSNPDLLEVRNNIYVLKE